MEDNRTQLFFDLMDGSGMSNAEVQELYTGLRFIGYFEAPAALKHHSTHKGGLFDHSYAVTQELLKMTLRMPLRWSRQQSPYIIGMLHDLCKTDDYAETIVKYDDADPSGHSEWVWNKNSLLNGHGDKSIQLISTVLPFPLTMEEMMCIRWHMGAFDEKENWGKFSAACKKYPNLIYVHAADMWASQALGI